MTDRQHDAAPQDPDLVLITDYLAGALAPAEESRIERRLEDDEVFFDKVFPLIRAWRLPDRFRARRRRMRPWIGALVAAAALALVVAEAPRHGVHVAPRRAPPMLVSGSTIATGPVETREVMLEDSTRVVLRPRTTLVYSRALTAGAAAIARMRGEAVFDVSRTRQPLTVLTAGGLMALGSGRYAIRCADGARETLVTVERGTALLRSAGAALGGWLALGAGEFGQVRDDAPPRRADGAGFPRVASSSE